MFTKTKYFQFIDETFTDMRALIERKNNDYTAGSRETDPFRNFREARDFGIDPLAGLANRMNDKFNRVKAFCAAHSPHSSECVDHRPQSPAGAGAGGGAGEGGGRPVPLTSDSPSNLTQASTSDV